MGWISRSDAGSEAERTEAEIFNPVATRMSSEKLRTESRQSESGARARADSTRSGSAQAGIREEADDCPQEGPRPHPGARPKAIGKFIRVGGQTLYIRGVTYGAFEPDEEGREYQDTAKIERDFSQMAANGINAVRIPHTTPPRRLLDIAMQNGLWVMVGLSAESYVGLIIDRDRSVNIERTIRNRVRECAGHPALLCYALGNEMSAPVVRWYGKARIERYLRRITDVVRREDPEAIVSYVNYPTTEYLDLPFLDMLCFNVYLEDRGALTAYLARLQNLAGNRPLLLSEVGLDSIRNGTETQADVLRWQIETAFSGGCTGVFIFAWTDEWYRGGSGIDDWAFGITAHDRSAKPALAAVRETFAHVPFSPARTPLGNEWPKISVVVCSHNGSRTISECLAHVTRQGYPDYEVIVVDDGSTDETARIADRYGCRVISTESRGLSSARNTGMEAATGKIIAYIDDDAYPDSGWLTYLASAFEQGDADGNPVAAVGGPNIAPYRDGWVAHCVAGAPGGPTHVLVSDRDAEHIPGCNMAFRKDLLMRIGGFDPQFRTAGDDVDVCWRLSEQGQRIGFHGAACVWHHRRNSVRAYWRQQRGYGIAERLLMRKWPEKYNEAGRMRWAGRIYGTAVVTSRSPRAQRVYHGRWGSAPFQRMYAVPHFSAGSFALTPQWYFLVALLGCASVLAILFRPLIAAVPLFVISAAASTIVAWRSVRPPQTWNAGKSGLSRVRQRLVTALMVGLYPLAHRRGAAVPVAPAAIRRRLRFRALRWPSEHLISRWTTAFESPEHRLESVERTLRTWGAMVRRGTEWDPWDLEVGGGRFRTIRVTMAQEEFGTQGELVRWKWEPAAGHRFWSLAALPAIAAGCAVAGTSSAALVAAAAALIAALVLLISFGRTAGAVEAAISEAESVRDHSREQMEGGEHDE